MKKKKAKLSEKIQKQEEQSPNSSPVCYVNSSELRPEYQDEKEKAIEKSKHKD